jgi:hypothetical protein
MPSSSAWADEQAASVSPIWRRAARCAGDGDCIEVAHFPEGEVAIRSSKDAHGNYLTFSTEEWRAFVDGVESGEFDT